MLEFRGECFGIMISVNNGSCPVCVCARARVCVLVLVQSRTFEMPQNIYHHHIKILVLTEEDMNMWH